MNKAHDLKQLSLLQLKNPDEQQRLEVHVQDNTLWMNQKKLAELFGMEVSTISYYLKELLKSGELDEATSTKRMMIMQLEGKRRISRALNFYNLDAILAIAFRANSVQGAMYRRWMTSVLRQFIMQGFVLEESCPKET